MARKKDVLIIDDDAELAEELTDFLCGEGYAVTVAPDGYKGAKCAAAEAYQVVLLDIKIPGANALEILKGIKKTRPRTRVFIISGAPNVTKLLESEGVGGMADGVIGKPFDIDAMLEKIRG